MKISRRRVSAEKKQTLIEAAESYLKTKPAGLLAAYVFGSFVTGEDFADIDLALLFGSDIPEPLRCEIATENELEKLLRVPVDVRVLNTAPLSFQHQVIRDGRLIIDRAPNRRADFEGRVLKQYFDFSRFRRRYLKEATHAPL